jgi:hypothetical protein
MLNNKIAKTDISKVIEFVGNRKFDEVKELCRRNNIYIKEGQDKQSDLYLVVSSKVNEEEIKQENEIVNENRNVKLVEQCQGIILEKETNKVVCMAYNKIKKLNDWNDLESIIEDKNVNDISMEYCEDGTVIRLYNYKDVWYTATTRCINANSSYWTSMKSFSDMFWDIFDEKYLQDLDKNYTYHFIILDIDNRIVVKHEQNSLVYISRIHNETFEEDFDNIFKECESIKRTEVISDDEKMIYNDKKRGVIIKIYNENNTYSNYRIDYEEYKNLKMIRGNVPRIGVRYLELIGDAERLQQLVDNYNEYYFTFSVAQHSLNKAILTIYELYKESHIKHTVEIKEGHMYYKTLRQLHAIYKISGERITLDKVREKVYTLDKSVLKKFIGWV